MGRLVGVVGLAGLVGSVESVWLAEWRGDFIG